jgi:hypothetical protein
MITVHILFPCCKYSFVCRSKYKILAFKHAGDILMQTVRYTKTNQCICFDCNKLTVKFRTVVRQRESLRTLV